MARSFASVLTDALRLDDGERAELASALLSSLGATTRSRAESAGDVEADAQVIGRQAALRRLRGTVRVLPQQPER